MSKPETIEFGPYNLGLLPSLKITDLKLDINNKITHFWGQNGVGKSTVMNLIVEELLAKNLSFSFINQDYRQNWLWWYSPIKNLSLAAGLKNQKEVLELPEVKKQWNWLEGLLESKSGNVNFAVQDEMDSLNLSGGQLQRLTLFREILRKPKFLLLDEAFSALDKAVVKNLTEWLLEEQKRLNFKIISISHDTEILEMLPGAVWDFSKDEQMNLELKIRKSDSVKKSNSVTSKSKNSYKK